MSDDGKTVSTGLRWDTTTCDPLADIRRATQWYSQTEGTRRAERRYNDRLEKLRRAWVAVAGPGAAAVDGSSPAGEPRLVLLLPGVRLATARSGKTAVVIGARWLWTPIADIIDEARRTVRILPRFTPSKLDPLPALRPRGRWVLCSETKLGQFMRAMVWRQFWLRLSRRNERWGGIST